MMRKYFAVSRPPRHLPSSLAYSKAQARAEAVKEAMQHTWNGYKSKAWGSDELKPMSGRGHDNWGGPFFGSSRLEDCSNSYTPVLQEWA